MRGCGELRNENESPAADTGRTSGQGSTRRRRASAVAHGHAVDGRTEGGEVVCESASTL